MQPKFVVDIIINSAIEVFRKLGTESIAHICTNQKDNYACEGDFTSVLEFSGHAQGIAALCLDDELARRISLRLTGMPHNMLTDAAVGDTVGELINQIIGASKTQLDSTEFYFSLHTPKYLKSQGNVFATGTVLPCIRMQFRCDQSEIVLLLTMLSSEGQPLIMPANAQEDLATQENGYALEIDPDMQEIVDGFVVETEECLEKLDQDLIGLESDPTNTDLLNTIFRALHTVKGNSKALGFDTLNTLVHRTEDVIRKVRDGEMRITPAVLDTVLEAADCTKALVADIRNHKKSSSDLSSILDKLSASLEQKQVLAPEKLIIDPEMEEIVSAFVVESEEIVEQLDRDLLAIDAAPHDTQLISSVFRAYHTLKGNSRALGFNLLEEIVHKTEDVIRSIRDGMLEISSGVTDVILRSVDIVKSLLSDIKARVVSTTDLSEMKAELQLILDGKTDELKKNTKQVLPEAPSQVVGKTAGATIRVSIQKLDNLINETGELVLVRNQFLNLLQNMAQGPIENVSELFSEICAHMSMNVSELQSSIMSARMQPISKVFSKYPRVVRDLARDLGKEIDLIISGESTELDNTIVEEIGDPLIHLVRNSCDHGIELPEERISKGKQAKGRVDLLAYQEGSFVVIEIRDDGKGLDEDILKGKAVSKGLITAQQASVMPSGEAFQLIFLPGFSTVATVTSVSGRGVGMDVVKTSVAKLNGIIELESEVGKGTRIRIRLPLTLAVMLGLEIESGGERYILPQEIIVEIIPVDATNEKYLLKDNQFLFRNEFWNPCIDLTKVLYCSSNGHIGFRRYIIVIGDAQRRVGLLVDNVLQLHEVVIKPLGKYVGNFSLPQTSGATIMGDGSIELILNPQFLLALGEELRRAA